MQKAFGAIQRLAARLNASIDAQRQLGKEPVPALSVEWNCEPTWESWTAARQIETVPFARRPIRAVARGPVSTTSYPLT